MYDPHAIIIYIDGSALKNPGGPGGIAGIVVFPEVLSKDKQIIFRKGFNKTTNNRMELRACLEALKWVRTQGQKTDIQRKILVTDSDYVNKCWKNALQWQNNGWVAHDGLPIDNYRLIRELISTRRNAGSGVELQWQLGKTDEYTNEVDKVAKSMAHSLNLQEDEGFSYPKIALTKVAGGRATEPCHIGVIEVARVYKKETHYKTGLVKVSLELFSRLENKYTEKKHAYIHTSKVVDLHRHRHYRLVLEGEKRVPIIAEYTEIQIVI